MSARIIKLPPVRLATPAALGEPAKAVELHPEHRNCQCPRCVTLSCLEFVETIRKAMDRRSP